MVLKVSGKTLMKKTRFANTSWLRFKGLMFVNAMDFDYALIFNFPFESRLSTSIHMMFMKFSADIIYLNKRKEVVDKVTLKPWTLNYTPKKAAKYVIELPQGKTKSLKIGDKLSW